MPGAVEVLRNHWRDSAERLAARLAGLTDDEFFREPVPGCWSVRPDGAKWQIDYDWPAPVPPPVTTIAWRLVHLANGNWIYWEHAFGPGRRTFLDLTIPGSAQQAVADWTASREPLTSWLAGATDADLVQPRPSHLGAPRSAGTVLAILVDEQVHHGAEIALLRDLYRAGLR